MVKILSIAALIFTMLLSSATFAAIMRKIKNKTASLKNNAQAAAEETASNKKNILFSIDSYAGGVDITGDFTGWKSQPMSREFDNKWNAVFSLEPGTYGYNFVVSGKKYIDKNTALRGKNPEGGLCSIIEVK